MRTRLDSLTGLRFLAALLVFGYHAGGLGRLEGNGVTTPGRAGVSFFFVLSGFLLTWTARPNDTRRAFYQRRVARIVPSYLVALLLVLGSTLVLGAAVGWVDVVPFTLLQSWVPDKRVFFAVSPVFWSLSTEAFFYLIFPFVLPVLRRLRTRGRLVGMAVFLVVVVVLAAVVRPYAGTDLVDWLYYVAPPVRFAEFALGMLLALQLRHGRGLRVPLALAVGLVVAGYAVATRLPATYTAVAATLVPFALLVWSAAYADVHGLRSPFRNRALVTLGVWSYGFYLLHLRVIQVGAAVARKVRIPVDRLVGLPLAALVLLLLALGVAASALLYHVVERPLEARLRPGHRAPDQSNVADNPLAP